MKRFTLFFLISLCFNKLNSQINWLDPTFGNSGIVTTTITGNYSEALAMCLRADGKIIVTGYGFGGVGTQKDIYVLQYEPNGDLDSSFGINGKARLNIPNSTEKAFEISLQQDGKIVVSGVAHPPTDEDSADYIVARFNSDGTIDNSFNGIGYVVTDFSNNQDWLTGMAITNDQKIIIAGLTYNYIPFSVNVYTISLAKYLPDGSFDSTFGTNGKATLVLENTSVMCNSIDLQTDGKIIIAGGFVQDTLYHLVARLNADATLDLSFNSMGYVKSHYGNYKGGLFNSVKIQSDGKIVAAGYTQLDVPLPCDKEQILVTRYEPSGAMDNSFNGNGTVIYGVDTCAGVIAYDLNIGSGGKLLLGGTYDYPYDMPFVSKLQPSGTLDNTFGNGGSYIIPSEVGVSQVIEQPDGKILASIWFERFRIARLGTSPVNGLHTEKKSSQKIHLYPNPTTNYLNIECNLENTWMQIQSTFGDIILSERLNLGINKIELQNLERGIYLATFTTENMLVKSEKLVIIK